MGFETLRRTTERQTFHLENLENLAQYFHLYFIGAATSMTQYSYRPLAYSGEIRVIRLFTEHDDPKFAKGPIHCTLEHVRFDSSQFSPERVSGEAVKGHDGTWPPAKREDFCGNSKQDDRIRLWKKKELDNERLAEEEKLNATMAFEQRAESLTTREESLPWRYIWGDYVALSYVWGDANDTAEIYLDGIQVTVRANLQAALSELRKYPRIQQGFRLWIDALCINQDDVEERARQVAIMKDIYASAWHVAVWLGAEANDSDLAITALQYFSLRVNDADPLQHIYRRVDRINITWGPLIRYRQSYGKIIIKKAAIRAIYHFLTRPYWRRLWILQEVALGHRSLPVLCGSRCISLQDIYQALKLISIDGTALGNVIIRSVKDFGAMYRSWDSTLGDTYGISEKLWERPIEMIELQQQEDSSSALFEGPLGAFLLSREAFASDQRDRVYGILGLPCLSNAVSIWPDYFVTANETFKNFSQTLFASGDLNGLRLINSPVPSIGTRYFKFLNTWPRRPKLVRRHVVVNAGCTHGLPSWVICWICPSNPAFPFPVRENQQLISGPLSKPQFDTNSKFMTIKAVLFDTVTSLSSFHSTESDASYPHTGPPRKSIYGDDDATNEALWRTLVANMTRSGATAPDTYAAILSPALWSDGTYGEGSKRWLFGLNDFYWRNRRMVLFDRTLQSIIQVKSWPRELMPVPFANDEKLGREASLWAMRLLAWRRLVTTDKGYLGLMPAATVAGDCIAVVQGCAVPLVLRRDEDKFRVIGECYVHGITAGELIPLIDKGEIEMVQVTLC